MAEGIIIRSNLPDFKKQMASFGAKLEKNIVRSATNAAAQVFRKAAVGLAPVLRRPHKDRTAGTLRRAIYVWRRRDRVAGVVKYSVSFRKGKKEQKRRGGSRDAFYGRFLEDGWVRRGAGQSIRGGKRRRALERSRLIAGGAKVHRYPFLAPAFAQAQSAALDAFNRKMEERIAKASRER